MILFPAIDLKDGQCVRLLRGAMDGATVFNDDPGAQARIFEEAGCDWLHVVDLEGAFEGRPVNGDAAAGIRKSVSMKIQLGGGIRDRATIDHWLEAGIDRVILGTAAVKNPDLVKSACKTCPGRIVVGVDARDGFVAVEGWAEVSRLPVPDLAKRFEDAGVAAVVHTDISRDGAMRGPNLEAAVALAKAISIPVILSGGVSSMNDLRAARDRAGDLLEGAIAGRAIYDGVVDPAEANAMLAEKG